MLAGLIRAPSALSPIRDLEPAQQRADTVLQAMTESGSIRRREWIGSERVIDTPCRG